MITRIFPAVCVPLQILIFLALPLTATAQDSNQLLPLALSGYNADVIAEGIYTSATALQTVQTSTPSGPIDNEYDYYIKGFNPNYPGIGLPAGNTFVAETNPNTTFLIQPTGQKNALLLFDQASSSRGVGVDNDVLTLTTPGNYNTLAVLATGLESSNPVGYVLQFADSGPGTEGTFTAPDNGVGSGQVALSGFGRVSRVYGTFNDIQASGRPRLYEIDIPLSDSDTSRTLQSIAFTNLCPNTNNGKPRKVAIFGVSGYSVMQPVLQPVALTGDSYNEDVIANPGSTALASTSTTVDVSFDYYAAGFNPDSPDTGLPAGAAFVSAGNPDTLFAVQPAVGNNVLRFNGPSRLTLANPAAYNTLALLTTGLNGDQAVNCQLNFLDGATTQASFTAPDNGVGTGEVALIGFGRVAQATNVIDTAVQDELKPRLFEVKIPLSTADAARQLASIDFVDQSRNGGQAAIFGLSATAQAAPPAPAGTLAFSKTDYTFDRASGSATITVSRVGGSSGPVAVNCSTVNGTAQAGVNYTAVNSTLRWGEGDTTDKTFTVPLLTPSSAPATSEFFVNLTVASGGEASTLGSPSQASVTILSVTPTNPVRAVNILSPPLGLTVKQGQVIEFFARVQVVSGTKYTIGLSFRDDATGKEALLTTFTGESDQARWTPPGAGHFTLVAKPTAPASLNGLPRTEVPITVVAQAGTNDVGPKVLLQGNVSKLQCVANDPITLVVSANLNGQPLTNVKFYDNGSPAQGNIKVVTLSAPHPAGGRHVQDALSGSYIQFDIAVGQGLHEIVAVGESGGISGVSPGVTINAKGGQGTGLQCTINNPADHAIVPADDASQTVDITASNNLGQSPKVTLSVGQQTVGTLTAPPYHFKMPKLHAGPYVLTATATDATATNKTANAVYITAAPAVPVVTVNVLGDGMAVEGGEKGKVAVTRTGGTSAPLTVFYKAKGSAVGGTDYKTLPGSVTIPAGASKAKIKIKPRDNATHDGTTKVKIKLTAPTDGSYELGGAFAAKVRVIDND